jgi:hypothetical protein
LTADGLRCCAHAQELFQPAHINQEALGAGTFGSVFADTLAVAVKKARISTVLSGLYLRCNLALGSSPSGVLPMMITGDGRHACESPMDKAADLISCQTRAGERRPAGA